MSLTLSWEQPSLAHQNGAILNYTLTCTPPAESGIPPMTSVFTTPGAHTLNGLTPATTYSCSVFATNIYGSGPPATVSAMTEDGGMCINLVYIGFKIITVTVNQEQFIKFACLIACFLLQSMQFVVSMCCKSWCKVTPLPLSRAVFSH